MVIVMAMVLIAKLCFAWSSCNQTSRQMLLLFCQQPFEELRNGFWILGSDTAEILAFREAPFNLSPPPCGHCPFGGGGLNPCPDGLGHLFRENGKKECPFECGGGGGVNAIWAMPTWGWRQVERCFPKELPCTLILIIIIYNHDYSDHGNQQNMRLKENLKWEGGWKDTGAGERWHLSHHWHHSYHQWTLL